MIAEARASASTTDVELRNQVDYFATRCLAAVTGEPALPSASSMSSSVPPARDSTTPVSSQPRKVAVADVATKGVVPAKRAVTTPMKAVKATDKTSAKAAEKAPEKAPGRAASTIARGKYTIQVAAYSTLADAERLIAKLAARGVKAHVSGATKPFRVRLDFYPTRQAAQDEVASLKQRGIVGFVTTEAPRPGEKSP
jgi:cell division protein FtsN